MFNCEDIMEFQDFDEQKGVSQARIDECKEMKRQVEEKDVQGDAELAAMKNELLADLDDRIQKNQALIDFMDENEEVLRKVLGLMKEVYGSHETGDCLACLVANCEAFLAEVAEYNLNNPPPLAG